MQILRDGTMVKKWQWENLLDSPRKLEKRMRIISWLSKCIPSMPEMEFQRRSPRHSESVDSRRPKAIRASENDELWQLQRRIRPFRRIDGDCTVQLLLQLAEDLDRISDAGLVHGDICPGNLCMDDERCYLIDWEPSFWQIKWGRRIPVCTFPYIAPSERGSKEGLSSLSDKVALVLSLQRIYSGTTSDRERIKEIEHNIRSLSFRETIIYCNEEKVV